MLLQKLYELRWSEILSKSLEKYTSYAFYLVIKDDVDAI